MLHTSSCFFCHVRMHILFFLLCFESDQKHFYYSGLYQGRLRDFVQEPCASSTLLCHYYTRQMLSHDNASAKCLTLTRRSVRSILIGLWFVSIFNPQWKLCSKNVQIDHAYAEQELRYRRLPSIADTLVTQDLSAIEGDSAISSAVLLVAALQIEYSVWAI